MGILIGFVTDVIIRAFHKYLNQISDIDWSVVDLKVCIAFGILLIHVRTIYYFITQGSKQNEEVEKVLLLIEAIKKEGLSDWQTKQMYLALYKKVLDSVDLNKETKAELEKLKANQASGTPPEPQAE
ncbi:hypothetical protein [Spirosoma liriopis]|nr:hypothetical protein [Spirosoma liriopis]